jgi:hypothetical protein
MAKATAHASTKPAAGARYGSMSMAEGERNLRLFAEKVLPALKAQ